MAAKVVNLLTFIKQLDRTKMTKIIFRGWRKEPEDDWQEAYEVLTRRKKPFYVVVGRPETTSKQPEKDIDDQAELGDDND